MLLVKNLKQKRSSKKLLNKLIKLFCIQKLVDKQTYYLNLLAIYRIYLIFYISLLELYNYRLNNNSILKYFVLKLIDNKQE